MEPSEPLRKAAYRFDRCRRYRSFDAEESSRPATQYFRDGTKSIITRNNSPDVGFETSLNPYRGCEHGCIYCYARPTHEYLGFSAGLDFESKIMVKTNAPELLRAELESPRWQPQTLVLSGVTDPYQPVERKLRITRGCLEVLAKFRNPVAIITKNHLVTRDIDLLRELAASNAVAVNISVTSLDPNLQRVLEPRTTSPQGRLDAIRQLRAANIPVGVMVAPIIPGLTDHEVPKILDACAKAGAQFAGYTIVRLPWAVAPLFEHWLGGTLSGSQREGAGADPASAGKPAEQFAVAHAHDRRRNFRRANRVAIQSRLSSRRHRRAADAFVQIISPIDDSITLVWLNTVAATNMTCSTRARFAFAVTFKTPMSAQLSDYDYVLPRELIAQRPPERREDSRMMVLHRGDQTIEHRQFHELKTFLAAGRSLCVKRYACASRATILRRRRN